MQVSMRTRTIQGVVVVVVMVAAMLASVLMIPPPERAHASHQNTTRNGKIQFFNVSLKLVKCTKEGTTQANCNGDWRKAFDRMHRYHYRPDVINVLEVPFRKREKVIGQLANSLGGNWKYAHVDYGQTCSDANLMKCGNTMLVWRAGKFTKKNAAGENQVLRIRHYQDSNDSGACTDGELAAKDQVIGAKLFEKGSTRKAVVAGVHFSARDPKACLKRNLKHVNDKLEGRWPSRPITILAGDFNEPPDTTSDTAPRRRREKTKACWYKALSGRFNTTCSNFDIHYYDGLLETHDGTTSSICNQWTFNNLKRGGTPNACDDGDKHKRIDYVWLRWENDGIAERPSRDQVDARISGNTDDGIQSGVFYSDHRMLRVTANW